MKLFSNNCPKCLILSKKLDDKNLEYEKIEDFQEIIEKGFKSLPILKVGEDYLDFGKAIKYVNEV